MPPHANDEAVPVFCARCHAELQPGAGDFFRVKIEAVADPSPPRLSDEDVAADTRREIKRLLAQLEGVSAQEALDQVFRRLVLHLCTPCYRTWIEDPTG